MKKLFFKLPFGLAINITAGKHVDVLVDDVLAVEKDQDSVLGDKALMHKWVSRDGRDTIISEMTPNHARNALAYIVHKLKENKIAYIGRRTGRILYAPVMDGLVAEELAFFDEKKNLIVTDHKKLAAEKVT